MSDDGNPVMDWRDALDQLEQANKTLERMTRRDVYANSVTVADICAKYGFKPTAISQIRKRNSNFPEPEWSPGHTDVFWGPDVDEFMQAYLLGKPTK